MLIKYIGTPDQITCDHNGKRYVFNKSNPIMDIPVDVFRLVSKESSGVISEYLMPYEPPVAPAIGVCMVEPKDEPKKAGRPKNDKRK